MTEVEKRRLQLLEDTRRKYSEKIGPPAVHPRFQTAYHSLYSDEHEEQRKTRNTFVIRVLVSLLIFAFCFLMDYRKEQIGTVDSADIIRQVQKDLLSEYFPFFIEKF